MPHEPQVSDSPDGEPFRYDVVREGETVSVRAFGELDMRALPGLTAEITQLRMAGCRRVIFDLRELSFLDSSGLRFFLNCHAKARDDGYSIALIPGPPVVQRVFELTGTSGYLPFVEP